MANNKLKYTKTDDEILKIVKDKEKQKEFIRRCIAVRVCPNCGSDMTHRPVEGYACPTCGWSLIKDNVTGLMEE